MDINILNIIDRQLVHLAHMEIENKERDYTHFHASQWDKCHRQIAYYYYEAKEYIKIKTEATKVDPQLQRVFGNGHSMHDRWRSYFEGTGALVGFWECANWAAHTEPFILPADSKLGGLKPEKCLGCASDRFIYREIGFLDQETLWGGHVDAIINIPLLQKYYNRLEDVDEKIEGENATDEETYLIIDFKTINPKQFRDLHSPLPEHVTQLQIYLFLSGLKYGKLLYEDKWTQAVKEYTLIKDDSLLSVKKAEAIELKHVVTHLNSQGKRVLPPRAHKTRSHRDCARCKFRGHCWKNGNGK